VCHHYHYLWQIVADLYLAEVVNGQCLLENRTRNSSFDSNMPSFRHRAFDFSDSLLDAANQDHFLSDCFLKKYTLKERCALIIDMDKIPD
jgi:hypothetical protein